METTTKKKTRTPRKPEAISEGLFKLTLEEKVYILKKLNENINNEVKALQERADIAASLLKN